MSFIDDRPRAFRDADGHLLDPLPPEPMLVENTLNNTSTPDKEYFRRFMYLPSDPYSPYPDLF